ncbi:unnamed protein product [Pleuronectes platessa]|uniref:Uncharacterized protein n=1 Tax=Pleuronectes platessa TaxID=8262 RepID=A0A9N7YPY8_PLEPL|nr:unnamed protein product [Pleuronectes platessa]
MNQSENVRVLFPVPVLVLLRVPVLVPVLVLVLLLVPVLVPVLVLVRSSKFRVKNCSTSPSVHRVFYVLHALTVTLLSTCADFASEPDFLRREDSGEASQYCPQRPHSVDGLGTRRTQDDKMSFSISSFSSFNDCLLDIMSLWFPHTSQNNDIIFLFLKHNTT